MCGLGLYAANQTQIVTSHTSSYITLSYSALTPLHWPENWPLLMMSVPTQCRTCHCCVCCVYEGHKLNKRFIYRLTQRTDKVLPNKVEEEIYITHPSLCLDTRTALQRVSRNKRIKHFHDCVWNNLHISWYTGLVFTLAIMHFLFHPKHFEEGSNKSIFDV